MSAHNKTTHSHHSKSANLGSRAFMAIHTGLYRLTGGLVGGKAGKFTFLLLTTTGRKSGRKRTIPIFYYPYEGRFLLIASNWGSEHHPLWWLNLQADPHAQVQLGRRLLPVTARQTDAGERAMLWKKITARYPNFARYQEHIRREIPVIILIPD